MNRTRIFRSGGFLVGVSLFACLVGIHAAVSTPRLNLQESPLSPELKRTTSFAPVAKAASRSVVNVYSSRTVRQRFPFLDDPAHRFFFGGPEFFGPREREHQAQGLGSGVIVSADGYILSNYHVVEDADDIKVGLPDGKELPAKVVGSDPQTDIAVLKIDARDLTAIPITDSDHVEVGDTVLAIGNPFGIGQTVTVGHVSGLGRGGFGLMDYEDFIQTDASINPGNSGGALIDVEGRLVGINTMIVSRSGGNHGVGFAIPANLARSVMERIIKDGKVTRGYLGVLIQPVTEELAREFKLSGASGALVGEVTRGSPAEKAGIKEGDIILELNGRKVTDSRHLRLLVAQAAPDTEVKLKVSRDGKSETVAVTLGELRSGGLSRGDRGGAATAAGQEILDGVAVTDVDQAARREFDLPESIRGAVVTNVEAASPAGRAGLRPGDVILEIDRRSVRDADEAIQVSRELRGGRVLLRIWSRGSHRYLVVQR
jgi:serine protease Do